VVGHGGEQDPENDRHRAQKTRCQHQGEDLCLVADFGETNDEGRYEESFHRSAVGIGREMNPSATFSARVLKLMSKLASNQ